MKKKPGWRTTEFWTHILLTVATVGGVVGGLVTGPVGAIVVAISQGAYAISRGLSKTGPDTQPQ